MEAKGSKMRKKETLMRRSSEKEDWGELEWKSDIWPAVAVLISRKERLQGS